MTSKKDKILDGYKTFFENSYINDNLYADLKMGQKPHTLVIACSDSRVDPFALFAAKPGELFVVRNVANIVPPFSSIRSIHHATKSAIEFGIKILEIPQIVVLGHSGCAGIDVLLHTNKINSSSTPFVYKWMQIIKKAKKISSDIIKKYKIKDHMEQNIVCSQNAIVVSLDNLSAFPWIEEKVKSNNIVIRGLFFNIQSGKLFEYQKEKNKFEECLI